MDPPPQYASTYGVLHFSNFTVKRALMPDIVLSSRTIEASTTDLDRKWPIYDFSNETNAKDHWESYQKMKEAELNSQRLAEAEEKEKKRIEVAKAVAAAERAKAEAEADELIRSRAAAAAAEKAKKEAEAEALIKARAEAAALAKKQEKEQEEKAARARALADVCSVTGLGEVEAEKLLEKHDGDSSRCIQAFFDDAMSSSSQTSPPPQQHTNQSTQPPVSISPSSSNSSISNMSTEDQARHTANLERIERIRQEDKLLASRMSNLQSNLSSHGSLDPFDPYAKERSAEELIRDYSTDDTFGTLQQDPKALSPLQAVPLQPFTAANPLIATDPFSSSLSPRTPVAAPPLPSTPTGVPPPVYPQPPAYGSVTGSDFPSEHSSKVQQLMALTHASESQCQLLLMCENYDLDRACDSFFSGNFSGGQ